MSERNYEGSWDIAPHRKGCPCTDCAFDRAQCRIAALEAENAELREQVQRMREALKACRLQMLQTVRNDDYWTEALEMADAALATPAQDALAAAAHATNDPQLRGEIAKGEDDGK